MRSRRARDKLFAEYEGLAVAAAERLWAKWGQSLPLHGVERDDIHSEARLHLMKLCSSVGLRYSARKRAGYMAKSLARGLSAYVMTNVYPKVNQIQVEFEENMPVGEELSQNQSDLALIYEGSEHEFALAMLNGDTVEQARKVVGWTKKALAEHLVNMRRQL